MNECERCGDGASGRQSRLWPNVLAVLCIKCLNEFDVLVSGTEAVGRREELHARDRHYRDLALAGCPATEEQILTLYKDMDVLEKDARSWTVNFLKPL